MLSGLCHIMGQHPSQGACQRVSADKLWLCARVRVVGRVRYRVGPLLPIVVTIFSTDVFVASGYFVAMRSLTDKMWEIISTVVLRTVHIVLIIMIDIWLYDDYMNASETCYFTFIAVLICEDLNKARYTFESVFI